jgi:type VI secretion system secreted protein Hcp
MGQSGIPHEELTLNFARIEMTYWPQGESGQSRGQKKMGWDRKQNRLT